MTSLANKRYDYRYGQLRRSELTPQPLVFFRRWFSQARECVKDFNAMSLSTIDDRCRPSSRMVLLKEIEKGGLIFYTDARSRKAQNIATNAAASALFYWSKMERQVRIEGDVETISWQQGADYFRQRPRDSQIAASVSKQSSDLTGWSVLEQAFACFKHAHPQTIPAPKHWQGYRLVPDYWEFWQGGENRLHHRFCYRRRAEGWQIVRLSP